MKTTAYTTDTSVEAAAVQLDCLRRLTPIQRFNKTRALSAQVKCMAFDALRRRHPDMDENGIQLRFIELTYGKQLADDVRGWKANCK